MDSNPAMLEAHGGPLKTGGAADAVADRTPASFSWRASEKRSAVSSPEFGGFGFTFRRTPERCRHSFLRSPLLSSSPRIDFVWRRTVAVSSWPIQTNPDICGPSCQDLLLPSSSSTIDTTQSWTRCDRTTCFSTSNLTTGLGNILSRGLCTALPLLCTP